MKEHYSDEVLVASLDGFTNKYATVNGIRMHYVEGGEGSPLILLSGCTACSAYRMCRWITTVIPASYGQAQPRLLHRSD